MAARSETQMSLEGTPPVLVPAERPERYPA